MSKVKMGFAGLSIPSQIERSRWIVTRITGNPNYPTPIPSLADLTTATDALEVAYNDSRNGDKNLMVIMRLRQKAMLDIIRKLAAYVQDESAGDEEAILSSGFGVVQRGGPLYVGQVLNLRTKGGVNSGTIRAVWDKVTGAGAYIVEVSDTGPAGESFTQYRVVIGSRMDITGLNPGGLYWIRVTAVGRSGYGLPSDPSVHNASVTY
ncbi:MAG: fibronectin type III domain-containing protein [Bacteroidetes bacterium]|nr:fibronectin type III domain-containing protein [Bacteroidota bacterium]